MSSQIKVADLEHVEFHDAHKFQGMHPYSTFWARDVKPDAPNAIHSVELWSVGMVGLLVKLQAQDDQHESEAWVPIHQVRSFRQARPAMPSSFPKSEPVILEEEVMTNGADPRVDAVGSKPRRSGGASRRKPGDGV